MKNLGLKQNKNKIEERKRTGEMKIENRRQRRRRGREGKEIYDEKEEGKFARHTEVICSVKFESFDVNFLDYDRKRRRREKRRRSNW